MSRHENSNEPISKMNHQHWMCGGRNSRFLCGIFFAAAGLLWLGKRAGWFSPELTTLFWPSVVIMTGVLMIIGALIKRGKIIKIKE